MNEELAKFLKKNLDPKIDYESLIEKPKKPEFGDFALPVFIFAKKMGKNPVELAKEFDLQLSKIMPDFLEKIIAVGPFVNFYLNNSKTAKKILEDIKSEELFKFKSEKKEKIIIEYPSPNTNKSLHIGHVRNILLGNALGNILEETGSKVIRINLNNDRGIAVCKAMLGYEMFFKGATPQSENVKPDQFVSQCYVRFEAETKNDESLNEKAQQMLVKWEGGDKEVIKLWKMILGWVYEGYSQTYKNLKLAKFDKEYFESDIYDKGKDLVLKALKDKIEGFEKGDDGAVFVDFHNETYGKKYLLRGDGTTLYMTQDLYLASLKAKEYKFDKQIFIVAKDQEYHFQVLFMLLDRMKIAKADKNIHYAYGYVYNKDGKKFSSRKGNVLTGDELIEMINEKLKENLLSKELTKNLDEKELERRCEIIGYCALSFSMLNINPKSDMKFDIEKALSFEGESGPYVLYTYARIKSILRKAGKLSEKPETKLFNEKENLIVKELKEYQNAVLEASSKLKPSVITSYLIGLCQMFNEYYHSINILKEEDEKTKAARLALIYAVSKVIKKSLELLNVETLEEM